MVRQETAVLFQDQIQSQKQKIDPKIILANTLLQLSGMELQQAIEQEITENPALELEENDPCLGCELHPFACKDCRHKKAPDGEGRAEDPSVPEREYILDFTYDPDDDEDPISRIRDEVTLHEHLCEQLRGIASPQLYEVGEYLINYIDENGYLRCDLMELSLELDDPEERIMEAISLIQSLDPPGVGARDLRECLLIQLRNLAEDGRGNPIAEQIVTKCWEEVASRKTSRIASRLKLNQDAVKQALDFIQKRLNPYPAAGFRLPWDYKPSDMRNTVRPDVIIHRTATGYEVEVVANENPALSINPQYGEIYNDLRNRKSSDISAEEKRHIISSVERAELFIKNLTQRRKTLRSISRCIVEEQHGYLSTGSKLFLRPLTRSKVAELLGTHESTVSRATANKYIQLPSQELVSFDFFFHASQTVMDIIAELMETEDQSNPLRDQDIADILAERGYPLSRRTVTKYRKAKKILSSHHRHA